MWRLKSCRALTNIKKLLPRRQRRSSTIRRRRGVPDDVKKGHFAVVVRSGAGDQLTRRAVVPLRCLRNPEFVKLLEQAADEYGFRSQEVPNLSVQVTIMVYPYSVGPSAALVDPLRRKSGRPRKYGTLE
ncbi:Protein SMALL AUXIN UP-REGULATED RNA 16 [Linum perenne]